MDQVLIDLFLSAETPSGPKKDLSEVVFRFINEETGEIEIDCADGKKKYITWPISSATVRALRPSTGRTIASCRYFCGSKKKS